MSNRLLGKDAKGGDTDAILAQEPLGDADTGHWADALVDSSEAEETAAEKETSSRRGRPKALNASRRRSAQGEG